MTKIPNDISDFDDLLFENRNKDYGAYQLRKRYPRVLLAGVLISVLIGCLSVLIPFAVRPDNEKVLLGGSGMTSVRMENLEPPDEKIYIPPAPPPPDPTKIQEIIKYVAPEVVDTVINILEGPATTDEILAQPADIETELTGSGSGDMLFEGEGSADGEEPFYMVEEMPSFRGGDINKFREWIYNRTNYPQAAVEAKIRGTVYLTFIVEKDGSVSNVIILKGVHPLLDNEAVKTISESPKWSPGLQRGQPVRVRFQIPVSFTL